MGVKAVAVKPGVPLQPCVHARCRRRVFPVWVMKQRGAPETVVLDAEPSTWEKGARIKLTTVNAEGRQLAQRLTNRQLHLAFAVREFYVPHEELCEVARKKRPTAKRGAGHA